MRVQVDARTTTALKNIPHVRAHTDAVRRGCTSRSNRTIPVAQINGLDNSEKNSFRLTRLCVALARLMSAAVIPRPHTDATELYKVLRLTYFKSVPVAAVFDSMIYAQMNKTQRKTS